MIRISVLLLLVLTFTLLTTTRHVASLVDTLRESRVFAKYASKSSSYLPAEPKSVNEDSIPLEETNKEDIIESSEKNLVNVFNLSKPLEPRDIYKQINCRKAFALYGVQPTLCFHGQSSASIEEILNNGSWNPFALSIHRFFAETFMVL